MTMAGPSFPDRASLQAHQLARLRELLGVLLPANRFYAARLQAAGVDSSVASLEEFCRRAPFTLKQELVDDQRRNPPYGANLTYPLERYTRFNQTSGTAGEPLRWLDTPESWNWMLDNWAQVYAAADVFVFPSRTDTFGLVLLEAMACGLPVAAYPVTGPRDVIGDSRAGVLHEDLRTACLAALKLSREDALARARLFSWRAATEQFLGHLHPRGRDLPAPALAARG